MADLGDILRPMRPALRADDPAYAALNMACDLLQIDPEEVRPFVTTHVGTLGGFYFDIDYEGGPRVQWTVFIDYVIDYDADARDGSAWHDQTKCVRVEVNRG